MRGHQATKAASGKLSKAHITQPPAYFTSMAAELSSLPTMLINWLFCQSKHSNISKTWGRVQVDVGNRGKGHVGSWNETGK
jgi:hypothetical protein